MRSPTTWCWRCSAQLKAWADDAGHHPRRHHRRGRTALSPPAATSAHLYDLGIAGRQAEALQFWRDEYPLNALIKNYRKPYVALIDGIVMGGGVGVSVHGSHRVAGDRFSFAMPEVGIGFFPDVGATWFLPRLPGELGTYCALTGERFNAADGVAAGVATHRVPSARFPDLLEGLMGTVSVDATLAAFAEPAGEGPIMARRATIDRLFAHDTRRGHSRRARPRSGRRRVPTPNGRPKPPPPCGPNRRSASRSRFSRCAAARQWDFETCMRAEFRIVSRIIEGHDFYEGVRAVIVDKDNKPHWNPATLAAVERRRRRASFRAAARRRTGAAMRALP